jgi:hypothetical protein
VRDPLERLILLLIAAVLLMLALASVIEMTQLLQVLFSR